MSYTPAQVEEALQSRNCGECGKSIGEDNFSWADLHYESKSYWTSIGRVEVVSTEGGNEGDGEYAHIILKVHRTDQHFKKTGYYYSYDGLTMDGALVEVHPTQKTVTVYE